MTLKRDMILSGVVLTVIGILFLAAPTSSALAVASLVGVILILEGLARGWGALRSKDKGASRNVILVFALLLIVLGIILVANPGTLVAYSYIIFGVIMILNALAAIVGVMKDEIRVRGSKALYLILYAALAVVGVIVLFNPFSASDVMMRIIGVTLIADGIADLVIAFGMHA